MTPLLFMKHIFADPPPSIPRCINCLFLTFRLNPDIPIEVAVASPQREISAAA